MCDVAANDITSKLNSRYACPGTYATNLVNTMMVIFAWCDQTKVLSDRLHANRCRIRNRAQGARAKGIANEKNLE